MTDIGIVGAGVNGVCCAIALARRGYKVTIYEAKKPFSETSSKSSKLLHGGIRYLENFQIKLVKEALEDRADWIKNIDQYTKIRRFYIPIYKKKSRSRFKLFSGVKFYELLAGKYSLGRSKYHTRQETIDQNPNLSIGGLLGSVSYIDVQMEDQKLSNWLIKKAESLGVIIKSNTPIRKIELDGSLILKSGDSVKHKKIINACGPWVKKLLDDSNIQSSHDLTLVKGSHLFIDRFIDNPLVIQVPEDGRIVFALPYDNKTLIGTTEVSYRIGEDIKCSNDEKDYLINSINSIYKKKIESSEIIGAYAGVRPIVKTKKIKSFSNANRESLIENINDLTNIFGGKWTSAMRLGEKVSNEILTNES